jgi:hypothetical protein
MMRPNRLSGIVAFAIAVLLSGLAHAAPITPSSWTAPGGLHLTFGVGGPADGFGPSGLSYFDGDGFVAGGWGGGANVYSSNGSSGSAFSSLTKIVYPTPQSYFGLGIGSANDYSTVTFLSGGHMIGSISGAQLWSYAGGSQGSGAGYYVGFFSDQAFNYVIAASNNGPNEPEAPPVNQTSPIPEPSSMLLLGTGLVSAGRAWRKRRA